jgi:hypothetical protein
VLTPAHSIDPGVQAQPTSTFLDFVLLWRFRSDFGNLAHTFVVNSIGFPPGALCVWHWAELSRRAAGLDAAYFDTARTVACLAVDDAKKERLKPPPGLASHWQTRMWACESR